MKDIAILIETALNSGRMILHGVSRYVHEREDWRVFHETGSLGAMEPVSIEKWHGDGIIARIASREILNIVASKGVPVVDVLGNVESSPFPIVKCDDGAIGKMGARHLLEAGHRNFAFLGPSPERWSKEREASFRGHLADKSDSIGSLMLTPTDRRTNHWAETSAKLEEWLADLPKPLGIMVASDQYGPLVLNACRDLALSVPEEIAITSVDNDAAFCNLCQPKLSSIEPNHSRIGYEAAALLDRIIEGETPSLRLNEIKPLSLHRRPSSDSSAVSDPSLVRALQYINRTGCKGISVDDVAAFVGLSRSVLQRRFKAVLGKTVGDALLQVRLRRARDLLSFTNLPLLDVAEKSGFNYQEYLNHVFKRHLNTTPAAYRRENKSYSQQF